MIDPPPPNSENGTFGKFGRPDEPSAPKGRGFGRLWRDSRFRFRNFENEANLLTSLGYRLTLSVVAKQQTRLRVFQQETSFLLGSILNLRNLLLLRMGIVEASASTRGLLAGLVLKFACSINKGPFFRQIFHMGGLSRNWRKIVKNGSFSAKFIIKVGMIPWIPELFFYFTFLRLWYPGYGYDSQFW